MLEYCFEHKKQHTLTRTYTKMTPQSQRKEKRKTKWTQTQQQQREIAIMWKIHVALFLLSEWNIERRTNIMRAMMQRIVWINRSSCAEYIKQTITSFRLDELWIRRHFTCFGSKNVPIAFFYLCQSLASRFLLQNHMITIKYRMNNWIYGKILEKWSGLQQPSTT